MKSKNGASPQISNAPIGVRDSFAGKHLLVTGVTGFLGKVWLAMLLDHIHEVRKVTVLIRGKKGESAEARFDAIVERSPVFRPLRERLGQALWTLVDQKVSVVEGKLVDPRCGLEPSDAQILMEDVDAVVHFAGLTDFEPDPKQAVDANIHGASHAADLAALSKTKRYVHVSTTFVAGMRSEEIAETLTPGHSPNGTHFDPQRELAALEEGLRKHSQKRDRIDWVNERARVLGWPNIYTYTKGLSEHIIALRNDVQTTTFRPAIVECATRYPFAGWNEGINTSGPIVWLISTNFRRFPAKKSNVFDVVPVDTVARTMLMVVAAALRDEAKEIYQCASGHLNPLRFERAVDICSYAVRRLHEEKSRGFEKHLISRLDAYCMEQPDKAQVLGYKRARQVAKALRSAIRDFEPARILPPSLYEALGGEKIDEELRSFSMKCRSADRKLAQVEDMLRQYRPFIYEYSYVFRTDHLKEETEALPEDEKELFGFDIESLCWRYYWSKVQVPGLDMWSLPLLRGEKIPEDEPLVRVKPSADEPHSQEKGIPLREESALRASA